MIGKRGWLYVTDLQLLVSNMTIAYMCCLLFVLVKDLFCCLHSKQVLIEAVENHMPQVIVIDEIGTKLEAMTASTISQRGIQLVATAHGVTIENLVMNPSLEMLVGGIQACYLVSFTDIEYIVYSLQFI